jgi:hypothetical protein
VRSRPDATAVQVSFCSSARRYPLNPLAYRPTCSPDSLSAPPRHADFLPAASTRHHRAVQPTAICPRQHCRSLQALHRTRTLQQGCTGCIYSRHRALVPQSADAEVASEETDRGRPGVAFLRSVTRPSNSTSTRFAFRALGEKRGTVLRKSPLSKVVFSSIFPVR